MKKDYSKKLERFTKKLEEKKDIIAAFYTGSTASQSWDEYSDIDIAIVVEDKDYAKIVKHIREFLGIWGEIKLINKHRGIDETYAYIGKDYLKVEIDPIKKSELKPRWELKNIRIAFDKDGTITKVLKQSFKKTRPELDHEELVHFFLDTRSNFIYVSRHYARGQRLSGMGELNRISGDLFYYLGKIKGMEGYENIRTAEKHLTRGEWDLLRSSSCRSLELSEVKRAIKSSWDYMKYLEKLYEKETKRKLNLNCNDKEILDVIRGCLDVHH